MQDNTPRRPANRQNGYPAQANVSVQPPKKKKKGGVFGRIVRRFFLLLFTLVILLVAALSLAAYTVFNGPSAEAKKVLTMTLLEPSATKWIPGVFMDQSEVDAIQNAGKDQLMDESTDLSQIVINRGDSISSENSHEWDNYPDGIRIDEYKGNTFTAHIMVIKDPARVSLGASYNYNGSNASGFSTSNPGIRVNQVMDSYPEITAVVNAGAFNDDGTANATVGSVPAGLTICGGKIVSDQYGNLVPEKGFAGFNTSDVLVVAQSMTASQATEQNIRDGCEFGPVLIINGEVNQGVYSGNSGYNPRTAIGQRADGAVIFVCADGRQAGSMGATYKDIIDIMQEYGAVNACNMDGGSSTIMYYRDTTGTVNRINSYSVLQKEPRRMPDFWMVK